MYKPLRATLNAIAFAAISISSKQQNLWWLASVCQALKNLRWRGCKFDRDQRERKLSPVNVSTRKSRPNRDKSSFCQSLSLKSKLILPGCLQWDCLQWGCLRSDYWTWKRACLAAGVAYLALVCLALSFGCLQSESSMSCFQLDPSRNGAFWNKKSENWTNKQTDLHFQEANRWSWNTYFQNFFLRFEVIHELPR